MSKADTMAAMRGEFDLNECENKLRERGMFGDLPWNLLCYAWTLKAERDEYKRRIDKVIAMAHPLGSEVHDFNTGFNAALSKVRALLAPKQEAPFHVGADGAIGWAVLDKRKDSVAVFYECPSQPMDECEKHAREFCDRLNNGARDE